MSRLQSCTWTASTTLGLSFVFVHISLLNGLHKLVELSDLLVCCNKSGMDTAVEEKAMYTTHLVDLRLVKLLAFPRVPLYLLRVHLPLRQEANLWHVSLTRIQRFRDPTANNMHRIFDIPVRSKLALDVFITQNPHLSW